MDGTSAGMFMGKVSLSIVLVLLIVAGSACLVPPQPEGSKPPLISSLEAEYVEVYPRGMSKIRCVAFDPEGGEIQFKWACTGGSLSGEEAVVTWEAPSEYGEYHIMVMAQDKDGVSTKGTLTINVVPRPYRGCCGR